ncbi:alpha/beta hydrolase [Metabacillus fastidiosus]|uniref:alpha/beta hydrolase n=1 Tax=Metabacillus fastidiosus TaxID=1458 RepID=UPI003D2DBDD1
MKLNTQVAKFFEDIEKGMQQFNRPSQNEISPQEARLFFNKSREFTGESNYNIKNIEVEHKYISGREHEIPIRIYTPKGSGPFPVMVFFHAGGWVLGDLDCCDALCQFISKFSKCIVVSVGYRLAPEYKYPKPLEDAVDAVKWVIHNINEINGDISRIAIGGESSGGNLAAVTAQIMRDSGLYSFHSQFLICPVINYNFDTSSYNECGTQYELTKEKMQWFWSNYLEEESQGLEPYASPLLAKDFSHLPPAIIATAEFDPLREEGKYYANRLKDYGVPVKHICFSGLVHSFAHMFIKVELAKEALEELTTELYNLLHPK